MTAGQEWAEAFVGSKDTGELREFTAEVERVADQVPVVVIVVSVAGAMTDKEKAARRVKREHNAALRAAEAARWEFLRAGFATRLRAARADLKNRAMELLVDAWGNREIGVPYHRTGVSARELLGVAPGSSTRSIDNPRAEVLRYLARNPNELLRVALAVGIGAIEDGIRIDTGYGWPQAWAAARPYFVWLKELDYEASEAERLELAGKAPK